MDAGCGRGHYLRPSGRDGRRVDGDLESMVAGEGRRNRQRNFAVCDNSGKQPIKLVYGGPVHTPIDVQYMYDNTSAMGYVGGSSFERTPTEEAIVDATHRFKATGHLEQDRQLMDKLTQLDEPMDYVAFVKEYVAEHYADPISMTELAERIHVSRTHLSALLTGKWGAAFPNI